MENNPLVIFYINEFDKNRKIGSKNNNLSRRSKYSIVVTSSVQIFLKSGKSFATAPYQHYAVMKYPTLKEPVVKIALFTNDGDNIYAFPSHIVVIPLESIEAVEFRGSGVMGIIGYCKNKGKI